MAIEDQNNESAEIIEPPYVLQKNGMYYAHNDCGYVSRVMMAEIYTEDYAKKYAERHEDVRAIRVDDLIRSSDEVEEYLERIKAMRDYMKYIESLKQNDVN